MPDFGGGYQSDRSAGGNGFGSSGRGGPGNVGGSDTHGNNSQRNSLYGYDPRTGRVVQVGAPSRLNGMLTTAVGYNMNRAADRARGGLGLTGFGINNANSPFNQGYVDNRQKNIRSWAEDRNNAFSALMNDIDRSKLGWTDRTKARDAAKSGLLGELDAMGFDTAGMRATHNANSWGAMFGPGTTADDVETMEENAETLGKVDPENPMGYSALGFLSNYIGPAVANSVYGVTDNPTAANISGFVSGKYAKAKAPSASKPVGTMAGVASMLGVPGAGPIGQALGLMERASRLGYSGYTGQGQPQDNGFDGAGGNDWVWSWRP